MQYFYVNPASEQVGPATLDQLKKAGITRDTLVWKEGMKEWLPAKDVAELQVLFAIVPPPLVQKPNVPPVPTPPPVPAKKVNAPERKRMIIAIGGILVALIGGAIIYFSSGSSDSTIHDQKKEDSLTLAKNDSVATPEPAKEDTVRIVDLDSLANHLKWDTTAAAVEPSAETGKDMSFLPGFSKQNDAPSGGKVKKAPAKKTNRETPSQIDDPEPDRVTDREEKAPVTVNPARRLTITGSFRKNLLFEAIMEGTIQNNNSAQVQDIIVEVRFLDESGQPVGTKRFTHHGPVAAGSGSTFRFKTMPPKGARGARYEIASASLR